MPDAVPTPSTPAPVDAPPAPVVTPPVPAPPAPAPAAPAPAPAGADPVEGEQPQTFSADYVAELRRENADRRTKAKAAEDDAATARAEAEAKANEAAQLAQVLEALRTALNPGAPSEEPVDPVKLAEQLASEQAARQAEKDSAAAQIRALQIEAALPSITSQLQADHGLTVAVLKAGGHLDKLDPSSETFPADLVSLVSSQLEANPRLKVAPVVTKTGTEPIGRTGGTDQITTLQGMTPEQIVEAQRAGRLRTLLGGS
jgi:hypothetical protein